MRPPAPRRRGQSSIRSCCRWRRHAPMSARRWSSGPADAMTAVTCWAGSAAPWTRSTWMTPSTSPRRTWPRTRLPACSSLVTNVRATPTPTTRSPARSPARIAAMSGRNFLIAGLIGRSHGLHDEKAADPAQLDVRGHGGLGPGGLPAAARPGRGLPADHVLTALAFAEAPGLPAGLWQLAVEALYGIQVSAEDLARFARSSAANFLVETGGTPPPSPAARGPSTGCSTRHSTTPCCTPGPMSAPRQTDERALARHSSGTAG